MAVASGSGSKPKSSDQKGKSKKEDKSPKQQPDTALSSPVKNSTRPGVGEQSCDSEKGKTCHQCRQKIMGFWATCKNQTKDKPCTINKDKPCTIKFCHKCLLNRYGEKAEEVTVLEGWNCPKCRGICNCSVCMKKRGHRPTGILVHTAKATGFSSVSELLHVKGPENFGIDNIVKGTDNKSTKVPTSNNEPVVSPRNQGKENSFSGNSDSNLHPLSLPSNLDEKKRKKMKREGLKVMKGSQDDIVLLKTSPIKHQIAMEGLEDVQKGNKINRIMLKSSTRKPRIPNGVLHTALKSEKKDNDANIPAPQGTVLTTIAGIDLLPEEVGHALQFLEFCAAFDEILDLKEGEPEYILQELTLGGRRCRGKCSPVVQFHIRLLSLIQKDLGENSPVINSKQGKNSWLRALQNFASRSQCVLKKLKLEQFGWEADDYDSLKISEKLKLLNFLCDEFICTAKIRSWIEDQDSKFAEKVKEAKERVLAAKLKEKQLKQKMQDEVAKTNVANGVSISEDNAVVSQIKNEAAQAHTEMLDSKGMVPKGKKRSDAVRTEPVLLDVNGRIYWRLNGSSDEFNILLQDVGTWDAIGSGERWFTYAVEQEKEIEKYICFLRKKRLKSQKVIDGI